MDVVCGDRLSADRFRYADEIRKDLDLFGDPVVLQLDIEIFPEHPLKAPRHREGGFILPFQQKLGDVSRKAGGKADEPFMMLFQQIVIDARPVIESVDESFAVQEGEVFVSSFVFAKKDQVRVLAVRSSGLVKTAPWRDISLHAEDGLDSGLHARFVKIDHAVHDAVVRDGQRGLPERFGTLNEFVDPGSTVQEAVLRMYVQMCERSAHSFSSSARAISRFNLWFIPDFPISASAASSESVASG